MTSPACSTVVHISPAHDFGFLADCDRDAASSEYPDSVERRGDGGPGTVSAITAS